MKKVIALAICFAASIIFLSSAHATVLTFEDLVGQDAMPDPYGIINWENNVWFHYASSQPPYNPASGVQRTYESTNDDTPSWDFLSDVVYNGSYFSGYDYATVQMDLYLDGGLVHSTGLFVPSGTPTFFATGYNGLVDRVVINTPWPDSWVMDDLTYNGGGPVVPEPASLSLLGLGLLGIFAKRKKSS